MPAKGKPAIGSELILPEQPDLRLAEIAKFNDAFSKISPDDHDPRMVYTVKEGITENFASATMSYTDCWGPISEYVPVPNNLSLKHELVYQTESRALINSIVKSAFGSTPTKTEELLKVITSQAENRPIASSQKAAILNLIDSLSPSQNQFNYKPTSAAAKINRIVSAKSALTVLSVCQEQLELATDENHPVKGLPALYLASSPQTLITPYVLFNLPNSLQFSYGEPTADRIVAEGWSVAKLSLSEKCQNSILRLLTHQSQCLSQGVVAGKDFDVVLLEFAKLGFIAKNYINRIAAAETFEFGLGGPSVQMQELAQRLVALELQTLNGERGLIEVLQQTRTGRYDDNQFDFTLQGYAGSTPSISDLLDLNLNTNVEYRNTFGGAIASLGRYSITPTVRAISQSIFYTPGHPTTSAWIQANNRLARLTYRGLQSESVAQGLFTPKTALGSVTDESLAIYRAWAGNNSTQNILSDEFLQVQEIFSQSLVPQPESSYTAIVAKLGKFLYEYKPRLLTASTFTERWSDLRQREFLVHELMFFNFGLLAKNANLFEASVRPTPAHLIELGHTLRQAMFSYEMGDAALRHEVEGFWYGLALNNTVPIIESNCNIARFVDAGYCTS